MHDIRIAKGAASLIKDDADSVSEGGLISFVTQYMLIWFSNSLRWNGALISNTP